MKLLERFRNLESFRPDVPLSRDDASRFLPWIIALMVYLTVLTLLGSFTLHRTVSEGYAAQMESFSVHIPYDEKSSADTAKKALAIVRDAPGVASAELADPPHIREMVEPWLGQGEGIKNLPLPTIIEAKLIRGADFDFHALKKSLETVAAGADIDDHKQWMEQFSYFVHLVQWMLLGVALLIMIASAAAVIFTCKTSLKIHRSSIALLHRLGAYDNYIASQFQHHAALLVLRGAFIGSGFAAGTLLLLRMTASHIDSPVFPSFALAGSHWVILIILPAIMTALALATARLSVLTALRKMP